MFFALGLPMTIAGAAVTGYGYSTRMQKSTASGGGITVSVSYEDDTTMYIGIGVMVPGIVLAVVGLPMLISGSVYAHNHKKVAMFFEPGYITKVGVAMLF